jgi:hypothetical protein
MKKGNEGSLERLVAFGLTAGSFGFLTVAYFYGKEIATLPAYHHQGGQGFALNAPLMMYGAAGLPLCFFGSLFLIGLIWRKWREVFRFPNPLTLLFLLPGLLVSARIVQVLTMG